MLASPASSSNTGSLELDAQGPDNGSTALHDAIWHGHTATALVYIVAGARHDLRGHEGWTPLDMALAYGYDDIVAAIETKLSGNEDRSRGRRDQDGTTRSRLAH